MGDGTEDLPLAQHPSRNDMAGGKSQGMLIAPTWSGKTLCRQGRSIDLPSGVMNADVAGSYNSLSSTT
ncbi:hypothetical protein HHI36_010015 [Cryptolaemus montrouzieri]|uniref:Uncharacterized protein n=1 Tax=Cryptolaemus montrouzieri TaxID=559131 RepID=A0ABD2MHL7_9CUCU